MNRRAFNRQLEALNARESEIRSLFLTPHLAATSYSNVALHHVGAYVTLLHAEVEHCFEQVVIGAVANGVDAARHAFPHPLLLNYLSFYRAELQRRVPRVNEIVGTSSSLKRDPLAALRAWEEYGGALFFAESIRSNHGAGRRYLEQLLHPLGIVVDEKAFRSVTGRGVRPLGTIKTSLATELSEFVELRGAAAHGGISTMRVTRSLLAPPDLAARAQSVLSLAATVVSEIAVAAC